MDLGHLQLAANQVAPMAVQNQIDNIQNGQESWGNYLNDKLVVMQDRLDFHRERWHDLKDRIQQVEIRVKDLEPSEDEADNGEE